MSSFFTYFSILEYIDKMEVLTEYYKFHKDVPRMFCKPTCYVMNKYHDHRRRIDYKNIMGILMQEAKGQNKRVELNEEDNEIRYISRLNKIN